MDDALVLQKGIKRSSDKVTLPPSVGQQLMAQNAPKNGPMMFELTSTQGTRTSVGVLEFSGPEGVVGLPRKVVRSLWPTEQECQGNVSVTYRYDTLM